MGAVVPKRHRSPGHDLPDRQHIQQEKPINNVYKMETLVRRCIKERSFARMVWFLHSLEDSITHGGLTTGELSANALAGRGKSNANNGFWTFGLGSST